MNVIEIIKHWVKAKEKNNKRRGFYGIKIYRKRYRKEENKKI